jgi:hypothetical protein
MAFVKREELPEDKGFEHAGVILWFMRYSMASSVSSAQDVAGATGKGSVTTIARTRASPFRSQAHMAIG